jgi:hypothetical protein
LIARGLTRDAKSASEVKGRSPRLHDHLDRLLTDTLSAASA